VPDQSARNDSPADFAAVAATGQAAPDNRSQRLRGVITDWGGVMTSPILHTVNAWLEAEQIDRASYAAVMRPWVSLAYAGGGGQSPIHALERGECTDEHFEQLLAGQLVRLDGEPVPAAGLLGRMFAASALDQCMHDLIIAVRRAGLRTGLLSNSWGRDSYPRELFAGLFDAVVISCEVGMRKPEPGIFELAARLLELSPDECVFIDDVEANVVAARAAGLVGVRHHDAAQTVSELSELLGVTLA
jgi:putative hydrolase of the HAD superfamily